MLRTYLRYRDELVILEGQRDPVKLAGLADRRVRATALTIQKALRRSSTRLAQYAIPIDTD